LADRFGRRPVLLAGYVAGAGVSLLLAVAGGSLARVAAAFALSGLAIAIEQTVEKACVAELLPASGRSYGLGLLATSNAFSDVVASVGVGLLWDRAGSASAFGAAAACSAVGAVVLVAVSRRRWRPKSPAPSS
jgi:MFS family permease